MGSCLITFTPVSKLERKERTEGKLKRIYGALPKRPWRGCWPVPK